MTTFRFYIIMIIITVLPVTVSNVRAEAGRIMEKADGYIEYVRDGTPTSYIKRIDLHSGKTEEVCSITPDNINAFDISPFRDRRILSISKVVEPSKLVTLRQDNTLGKAFGKGICRNPSFSPDGKSIAYLSSEYGTSSKNYVNDWYVHLTNLDGISDRQ